MARERGVSVVAQLGRQLRKLYELRGRALYLESGEPRVRPVFAPIAVVLTVQPQHRNARRGPVLRVERLDEIGAARVPGPAFRIAPAAAGEVHGGDHACGILRSEGYRRHAAVGLADDEAARRIHIGPAARILDELEALLRGGFVRG